MAERLVAELLDPLERRVGHRTCEPQASDEPFLSSDTTSEAHFGLDGNSGFLGNHHNRSTRFDYLEEAIKGGADDRKAIFEMACECIIRTRVPHVLGREAMSAFGASPKFVLHGRPVSGSEVPSNGSAILLRG